MENYKQCVETVVDMLRSIKVEPQDFKCELGQTLTEEEIEEQLHTIQREIVECIFSEMILYIPEKDRKDFTDQFNRSR